MLQLNSALRISGLDFGFSTDIKIQSSYNKLTTTAHVKVPRNVAFKDRNGDNITEGPNAIFKRGDEAFIWGGYNHITDMRFSGYVTGVKTKYPLEFDFEDEMYLLKQKSFTFALKNPKLSKLLEVIIPGATNWELTADRNIGDFRASDMTAAQILEYLKKERGVFSFFREGLLFVGLAVVPELQKTHRFEMFRDIINADNLTFLNDFDRRIKVTAKSILDNNTKIEASAGDADGATRVYYTTNAENVTDLQAIAESKLQEVKYTGYEGYFTTFLQPLVNHGDIVEIVNSQIPEQSGAYIVEAVDTSIGMNGGRQKISIKQKVYSLVQNSSGEWIKQSIA